MAAVAEMNFFNRTTKATFANACAWYHEAAERGHQESLYMEGVCGLFRNGQDTLQEDGEHWNQALSRLSESKDSRAAAIIHFAEKRIPPSGNLPVFTPQELYEKLRQEEKEKCYIYRGQVGDYGHPLRPSAYRPGRFSRFGMTGEAGRQSKQWGNEFYLEDLAFEQLGGRMRSHAVKRIMSSYLNNALGYPLTQAFFQQAGYSSEGLDVSYDLNIAMFFALYQYKDGSYTPKNSQEPSIIYRWELPKECLTLQDNYYSRAHFIPTLDILKSFRTCDTVEESVASLEEYLRTIGWGRVDFSVPARRPFEILRLPKSALENSRIAVQKGALLIPDFIPSYMELECHRSWGFEVPVSESKLQFKLVQDLAGPSVCESFLMDCSGLENQELEFLSHLPKPEDITHILTHGIFESAYKGYMDAGTPIIISNPTMPGYRISYQDALAQLQEWNSRRSSYQYFFD